MTETVLAFAPRGFDTNWNVGPSTRSASKPTKERQTEVITRELLELTKRAEEFARETQAMIISRISTEIFDTTQAITESLKGSRSLSQVTTPNTFDLVISYSDYQSPRWLIEPPVHDLVSPDYLLMLGTTRLLVSAKMNELVVQLTDAYPPSKSHKATTETPKTNHQQALLEEIQNLTSLPRGWDGSSAQPIHPDAIRHAKDLAKALAYRFSDFEPYPDPDGSVGFEGHKGLYSVYVNCAPSGQLAYVAKIGGAVHRGHSVDQKSLEKLLDALL